MRLNGKRAVITGGGSGIGLATAKLFVQEGAHVAILGRDQAKLDAAVASLGAQAKCFAVDVAHPDELSEAMRRASEALGGIDIVFANAGITTEPSFVEITEADFDALFGTNVKGTVFTVRSALPYLRDGASLILTGSIAIHRGRSGTPLYAATKGAITSFGHTLAMNADLLARRIRVNIVTPGATITPTTSQMMTAVPEVKDMVASMIPMARWGEAPEVAEAVLFLASDAAAYITGAEIKVDGGWGSA